jgi:2-oxoglutarate dehydrogenase E2 component (dihydrolipoamide succinyltransferase)
MAVLVDILPPADLQHDAGAVVERWLHQPGARVGANEPLLEINTDKAVVEVPAPADGVLREILKQANDAVQPGDVLGRIDPDAAAEVTPAAQAPAGAAEPAAPVAPARGEMLSPAVRQLVRRHGIDPAHVRGSGRGGRVTYQDVRSYLARRPGVTPEGIPRSRKIPHTTMRRRIAQHMVESALRTAPHVTAVFEADLSAVVAHRRRHEADCQRHGIKLTYTPYLVAAVVQAVKVVPEVNARWHDDALEVFEDCNVGIATAVPGGLIVPVIQRAQEADLFELARRLQELTARARAGKIQPQELQGGTFTITNHGVSGSLIATPIIFQPQVAILGVGKLTKRVVVVESDGADALQIRPMAYVTLTIDHRAMDGFQANTFLGKFVEALAAW